MKKDRAPRLAVVPVEIIYLIIEHAQSDDIFPRYKYLKSYSLISKDIGAYAQSLLFKRAEIRGVKACTAFKQALQTSPRLGACVQTLVIKLDHQTVYGEAISLCCNLHELNLHMYHASFRPKVLNLLQEHSMSVKALHMWSFHTEPVYQLLEVFASVIEHVSIDLRSSNHNEQPIRDALSCNQPFQRLTELRLKTPWSKENSQFTFTRTLELIPRGRLTILHLEYLPPADLFKAYLEDGGHCQSLRSLQFRGYTKSHLSLFPSFTALEEIQILAPLHDDLAAVIPNTLSHLWCLCPVGSNSDVHLYKLLHRQGLNLKVLTYNWHTASDDRKREVKALWALCRSRGISFRYFHVPHGTYTGEEEPLEHAASFPRDIPTSRKHRNHRIIDFGAEDDQEPHNSSSSGHTSVLRRVAKAASGRLVPSKIVALSTTS